MPVKKKAPNRHNPVVLNQQSMIRKGLRATEYWEKGGKKTFKFDIPKPSNPVLKRKIRSKAAEAQKRFNKWKKGRKA